MDIFHMPVTSTKISSTTFVTSGFPKSFDRATPKGIARKMTGGEHLVGGN
jgi:hypothetical protein